MTRPRRPNRKPTLPRKVAKNQMSKQEKDNLDTIFDSISKANRRHEPWCDGCDWDLDNNVPMCRSPR